MAVDVQGQGDDGAGLGLAQRHQPAPVNHARGQVPQQVQRLRPGQSFDQPGGLRTDAVQGFDGSKEREEDLRTQGSGLYGGSRGHAP
jgi:hypothetical protein